MALAGAVFGALAFAPSHPGRGRTEGRKANYRKKFTPAAPWADESKQFGHQTLRDNVALLDEELLQQIHVRIAAAGREVFAKKAGAPVAALALKVDSYVVETDVPFPTDLNLLWDAGRKCVDKAVP